MRSHLVALLIFSVLVSGIFALLLRDDGKSRLRFGLMAFGAFVFSALVVGWIMHPFPN